VDGSHIDSALILGDRPTSSRRQVSLDPHDSNLNAQDLDPAAVALPHTSSLLSSNHNAMMSSRASSLVIPDDQRQQDIDVPSSAHHLAALTASLLASDDFDGGPLIKNKTHFLLALEHQLLTIESCVQEASAMALTTIGDYNTEEDRTREQQEMRIQRNIISQSIRKDDRSGKSVVDNESILLAATVIATKAAAIAALTTGKESKKAEKVAKRYSVIADKANEMIIKKTIRRSANPKDDMDNANEDEEVPKIAASNGIDYYDEDDEGDVFRDQHRLVPEENSPEIIVDQKVDDVKVDNVKEERDMEKLKALLAEDVVFSIALQQLATENHHRDDKALEEDAWSVLDRINATAAQILDAEGRDETDLKEEEGVLTALLHHTATMAGCCSDDGSPKISGDIIRAVMIAIKDVCEKRKDNFLKNDNIDHNKKKEVPDHLVGHTTNPEQIQAQAQGETASVRKVLKLSHTINFESSLVDDLEKSVGREINDFDNKQEKQYNAGHDDNIQKQDDDDSGVKLTSEDN
jgi:hypothetical protein